MDAMSFRAMWVDFHGERHPLTDEESHRFVHDPLVHQIILFPEKDIFLAARRFPLLSQILAELNSMSEPIDSPDTKPKPDSGPPKPRHETSSASTGRTPSSSSRTGKSRQSGSVWDGPVNPEEAKRATVDFDRLGRGYQ
jgi:hypothetical protein